MSIDVAVSKHYSQVWNWSCRSLQGANHLIFEGVPRGWAFVQLLNEKNPASY